MATLEQIKYRSNTKKLEFDVKHRDSPRALLLILEAPKLELKALPPHLSYVLLRRDDTFNVIIAAKLNRKQVECLVAILKRFERARGWRLLRILLGSFPVFFPTKFNPCKITNRVLSTKEGRIHLYKK